MKKMEKKEQSKKGKRGMAFRTTTNNNEEEENGGNVATDEEFQSEIILDDLDKMESQLVRKLLFF